MSKFGFTVEEYREFSQTHHFSKEEIEAAFYHEVRDPIEAIEEVVDRNGGD